MVFAVQKYGFWRAKKGVFTLQKYSFCFLNVGLLQFVWNVIAILFAAKWQVRQQP